MPTLSLCFSVEALIGTFFPLSCALLDFLPTGARRFRDLFNTFYLLRLVRKLLENLCWEVRQLYKCFVCCSNPGVKPTNAPNFPSLYLPLLLSFIKEGGNYLSCIKNRWKLSCCIYVLSEGEGGFAWHDSNWNPDVAESQNMHLKLVIRDCMRCLT